MFPDGFLFFVSKAEAELAEPGAEYEGPAAQEDVTHFSHVSLEFFRNPIEAGLRVRPALVVREQVK